MAEIIYALCAITAAICTFLLLRAYKRARYRLLLWSGLCFAGLTLNNIALVVDKILLPASDLLIWRTSLALVAMSVLLFGLVWDTER